MNQVLAINIADIVEGNGKTVRQNNLEKEHNIPVGSLVEVKYSHWHGDGCCEKVHARLWVHSHDRDCDGTPLYSLSRYRTSLYEGAQIIVEGFLLKDSITHSILNDIESGFSEESLKIIKVTPDLCYGHGSLCWDDEEDLIETIGDCNTGPEKGLTPLEVLKRYPSARKKLLELVPEMKETILES